MPKVPTSGNRDVWMMSETGASSSGGRQTRPLAIPLLVAGFAVALALVIYDPNALLVLLVVAAVAFLLHLLAARLTEVDLMIPFMIGVGCLALVLWWFAPQSLGLAARFDEIAPAPVKRLFAPLGAVVSGPATAPDTAGGASGAATTPAPSATAASPAGSRSAPPTRASAARQLGAGRTIAAPDAPDVTVSLTSARATTRPGEPVSFTVLVRALKENAAFRCGRVIVFDGSSRVATAALTAEKSECRAVVTIDSLGVGSHSLTARPEGSRAASSPAVALTVR